MVQISVRVQASEDYASEHWSYIFNPLWGSLKRSFYLLWIWYTCLLCKYWHIYEYSVLHTVFLFVFWQMNFLLPDCIQIAKDLPKPPIRLQKVYWWSNVDDSFHLVLANQILSKTKNPHSTDQNRPHSIRIKHRRSFWRSFYKFIQDNGLRLSWRVCHKTACLGNPIFYPKVNKGLFSAR